MDTLHPSLAPMIAAWMGGALLCLASAGLKHRLGVRTRPALACSGERTVRRPARPAPSQR
jgi:hypothetical protein